ncbi:MAG: hypothetical protein Q7T56_01405 [Nocardioidaceae bacterium]|nr:hypothetical protein [Nocardioidaceae bacterium]
MPLPDQTIDTLHLRWYARRDDRPGDLAERWLSQCRRHLPAALPRRFGDAEPLRGRLDRDGDAGFVAALAATTGLLFTAGTRPAHGGSLPGATPETWAGPVEVATLAVDHDTDVRGLLAGFADAAGCFFAEATVEHGVLLSEGELVHLGPSGSPYLAPLGRFAGLPPAPVTWTWFGPPYVRLVSRHLPGPTELGGGLLQGWSEDGPDAASTWLPAALTARRPPDGGALEPASRMPRGLGPSPWSRLRGHR